MKYYCVISCFLVLLGQVAVSHQQACNMNEIVKCAQDLGIAADQVFKLEDPEALKKICSAIQSTMECVKRCSTGNPAQDRLIFGGLEDFTKELCTEGSQLSKDFLANAKCLGEQNAELMKCDTEFPIKLNSNQRDIQFAAADNDALKKICCGFYKNTGCKTKKSEDKCGKPAGDVIKRMVNLLGGPAIKNNCPQFKDDCNKCSNMIPSFLMMLGAAILYMFLSKTML